MNRFVSAGDCKRLLYHVADKINENKDWLTELDSAIGDGDHGIGMAGGMQKVREQIGPLDDQGNAYLVFETAGKAMLMSMGGASGVIFGSMFLAGAKNMEPKQLLGRPELAELFSKGLIAVKERGKARVGDKTMVDAFEPAVMAMAEYTGDCLIEMMDRAQKASHEGMESTKDMTAAVGRAKSLMERAVGCQDAGAASTWIIFKAMSEWVRGLDEVEKEQVCND